MSEQLDAVRQAAIEGRETGGLTHLYKVPTNDIIVFYRELNEATFELRDDPKFGTHTAADLCMASLRLTCRYRSVAPYLLHDDDDPAKGLPHSSVTNEIQFVSGTHEDDLPPYVSKGAVSVNGSLIRRLPNSKQLVDDAGVDVQRAILITPYVTPRSEQGMRSRLVLRMPHLRPQRSSVGVVIASDLIEAFTEEAKSDNK
jgi:hypothetical protein